MEDIVTLYGWKEEGFLFFGIFVIVKGSGYLIDGGLSSPPNERYGIAKLLRGRKVDIPDPYHLFEVWPEATSVHVDSLRIVVDGNLDKYELFGAYSES